MKNEINDGQPYIPEAPDPEIDRIVDEYFESARLPEVDTTSLTMMTHMKILQSGLLRSRRRWRLISLGSIAACIAVMVTFGISFFKGDGPKTADDMYAQAQEQGYGYEEMIVPAGQRMTLVLPDGTKLIANSRSQVRYPTRFVGDARTVWVSGEVYFDVAKDALKPFVVNAEGFSVRVYGTKFSISNYTPSDASVVLVEGSVAVKTDNDDRIKMRPGHHLAIRSGVIDEMKRVKTDVYTSWINGCIILDDQTLGDIIPRLSRYYNVKFDVAPSLNDMKLYGSLDLKDDIESVMAVLSSIIPMTADGGADGATYRLEITKQ